MCSSILSRLLLFFFAMMMLSPLAAQPRGGGAARQEKLKALRIAYFTEKLALTADEAKVFWPVYDVYSEEMDAMRKNKRAARQDIRDDFNTMNDKELEQLADEFIQLKQQEYEITAKYYPQFKKVLPIRKVVLFYKAEQEFPKWVLTQIRDMREGAGRD